MSTNSQDPRRSRTTHALEPHQSGTQFMVVIVALVLAGVLELLARVALSEPFV
jgi:hypothetical protein